MAELSDNDFALWERYRALGTPEHVEAALVERDDLARRATIREAAAIAGFKESALARLAGDLPIAVRDGAAFVATDGEETPLADYAAREWAEFLPSLKATEMSQPHCPHTSTDVPAYAA